MIGAWVTRRSRTARGASCQLSTLECVYFASPRGAFAHRQRRSLRSTWGRPFYDNFRAKAERARSSHSGFCSWKRACQHVCVSRCGRLGFSQDRVVGCRLSRCCLRASLLLGFHASGPCLSQHSSVGSVIALLSRYHGLLQRLEKDLRTGGWKPLPMKTFDGLDQGVASLQCLGMGLPVEAQWPSRRCIHGNANALPL